MGRLGERSVSCRDLVDKYKDWLMYSKNNFSGDQLHDATLNYIVGLIVLSMNMLLWVLLEITLTYCNLF